MLHRISTASTRRPWLVIGLWVVLLLGGALVGQMKLYDVTTSDTGGFLPSSYESARATAFGEKHFGVVKGATAVTALVKRDDGRPLTPADQARVATLTGRMAAWRPDWNAIPHSFGLTGDEQAARALKTVAGPTFGAGRFQLVGLQFRGNSTDPTVQKAFKQFRGSTVHAFAGDGLRVGFTGGIASQTDYTDSTRATTQLEGVLLLAAIALLTLVVFRGVLSTVVPLLTVVLVAGGANGAVVLAALAFGFHLDSSTPTLIETVLIGIGIDYFLFMTFRFRERLRAGDERKQAAAAAGARISPVIASAALAIMVAFAALGLAQFGQFRVLGPSVAVAIFVMLLAGITLVPAVLAATGRKLFWPAKAWQHERQDGPARRLGALVARRPGRVAIITGGLLAAFALAATGVRMNYDQTVAKTTQSGRAESQIAHVLPRGVTDPATDLRQLPTRAHARVTEHNARPTRPRTARGHKSQSPRISPGAHAAEIDVVLNIDSTTAAALKLAGNGGALRAAVHSTHSGRDRRDGRRDSIGVLRRQQLDQQATSG